MALDLRSEVVTLKESLGPLPEAMVEPPFIVVSGLPGSGKSYFCRRLAERLPVVILESDALRRQLFPSPTHSPEESARLFRACHELIEDLLAQGIPLVLDATNLAERHREILYHIAEKQKARLILVRVEAPPAVVKERLQARMAGASPEDNSDADWEVYRRMKSSAQRIGRRHFAVDTSRDISPAIEKIVREARR